MIFPSTLHNLTFFQDRLDKLPSGELPGGGGGIRNFIHPCTQEMLTFGVYVPDQDAKWETEGDTFDDLLQRPDTCDADVCLCPGGRK